MTTECNARELDFQGLGSRAVTARFDGGAITSDAGGLLLRRWKPRPASPADLPLFHRPPRSRTGGTHRGRTHCPSGCSPWHWATKTSTTTIPFATIRCWRCWSASRTRRAKIVAAHGSRQVVGGQEYAESVGVDAGGGGRHRAAIKKVVARHHDLESFFVETFLRCIVSRPRRSCSTWTPPTTQSTAITGPILSRVLRQLLLTCRCISFVASICCAPKLRPADIDGAAGSVKQLAKIVARIRRSWPQVRIVVRGDSGFCREPLMRWCEENHVHFVFGLAKNARLSRILGKELHEAKVQFEATGRPSRVFKEFTYQTRKSWSRERRVVGKARTLGQGQQPAIRGDFTFGGGTRCSHVVRRQVLRPRRNENRIKEQQLCLFADRTSCATMRANQLRLWLSSAAYTLLMALRQFGLQGTEMAQARCDTIRLKLLKVGALVRTTVRRVWISLSESCPYQRVFAQVYENLRRWSLPLPASG